jgi:FKBP-type peptidyl-prolyl cis-trans isomerase FklB
MRLQHATILVLIPLSFTVSAAELSLADETDRINYTIGHQIGTDFKKQQVDLNETALKQGLEDVRQQKQPLLDAADMHKRLGELKHDITHDMEAESIERMHKRYAQIQQKRQAEHEFMQQNLTKAGVHSTSSGLQYKIIKPGKGPQPKPMDRVKIDYRSRRLTGQVFDGSFKTGGTSVYRVNGVIPGFSEALQMMSPGAKWEIYLPWKLAYGRKGPLANEAIIIEVELLEILGPEAQQAPKPVPADK